MSGRLLASVVLLVVGTIHLLPLLGVLGTSRLEQLYQVRIEDPNLLLLMRHRALLFGLMAALLLAAAFRPMWQGLALLAAWGSVLGNALDHGMGYTPYGQHARNLCGLEVVLPDGDLMHTGMGAMAGNHAWHLFPLSYGPDWTHMFSQSNMGVVTKAGLWLQPLPETSLQLTWDIPLVEDIGWVIDTITPLKLAGVIDQNVFIPSWLGKIVLKGQRKDFWDKDSAIPDWRVDELLKEHKLGYWQVDVRLYGDETLNKARAEVVKAAFRRHIATPPRELWWHQGTPLDQYDTTMGVPSAVALQMGDWVGGRSAHMGFSPVVPATGRHVLGQLRRSRKIPAALDAKAEDIWV